MGSLQDIDQFAMLKPHVKWMTHVGTVRDIVPAVEKAFKKAQEGTPGPVFIEIAIDALYREVIVE
jgi:acetolactate synthase-like protein